MKASFGHALLAPAIAGALLLSGCSVGKPDSTVSQVAPVQPQSEAATVAEGNTPATSEDESASTSNQQTQPSEATQNNQGTTISPSEAAQEALDAHPGTQVVSVSLDRVRGVSAWEVEVASQDGRWEVSIDAVTGEVVLDQVEHSDDHYEDLELLSVSNLDYKQAIEAMLAAVPGGSLVELDLDDEHGQPVWEGEVVSSDHMKHEVVIDAVTGQLLQNEIDD